MTYTNRLEYIISLGLNRHGEPILPEIAQGMVRQLQTLATNLFGGSTLTEQIGTYISPTGTPMGEPGITLTILASSDLTGDRDPYAFGRALCTLCNQSSIFLTWFSQNGIGIHSIPNPTPLEPHPLKEA